jgi:hypothetical protein
MSDQPSNQEQIQNLSDDDLENVAGGNAPDVTIAKGQTKVFDGKTEEKLGTVTGEAGSTIVFG